MQVVPADEIERHCPSIPSHSEAPTGVMHSSRSWIRHRLRLRLQCSAAAALQIKFNCIFTSLHCNHQSLQSLQSSIPLQITRFANIWPALAIEPELMLWSNGKHVLGKMMFQVSSSSFKFHAVWVCSVQCVVCGVLLYFCVFNPVHCHSPVTSRVESLESRVSSISPPWQLWLWQR